MMQIVGTQYRVELTEPRWLLLHDESNYFGMPREIPVGVTWTGRHCSTFSSESEALEFIGMNNLTLKIEDENDGQF